MSDPHAIVLSRRIYARLLNLYPHEHHIEYGAEMIQVFTDQCRTAFQARRAIGLFFLWLRTLLDLGASVLREQLAAPGLLWGLLSPVPNAPLPWKGTFLVLLPGLVFFIAQVAQLQGKDWFFLLIFRAAYFLIIPVLLIWLLARRFPIWGLVPLGLLFKALLDLGDFRLKYKLLYDHTLFGFDLNFTSPDWLMKLFKAQPEAIRIAGSSLFLMGSLFLLWWVNTNAKKYSVKMLLRGLRLSSLTWYILSAYVLLVVLHILINLRYLSALYAANPDMDYLSYSYSVNSYIFYDLYNYGGFLFLVLLGAPLSRRHGRLAALLPLGYLLPTILAGRYFPEQLAQQAWLAPSILAYRLLVALIAPLWIVRSATAHRQSRASAVSLLVLVGLQIALNAGQISVWTTGQPLQFAALYVLMPLVGQLILAAGILLALQIYLPNSEQENLAAPATPDLTIETES